MRCTSGNLSAASNPTLLGALAFDADVERLESELDNVRAALRWCIDRRRISLALPIALAMQPCGFWRGMLIPAPREQPRTQFRRSSRHLWPPLLPPSLAIVATRCGRVSWRKKALRFSNQSSPLRQFAHKAWSFYRYLNLDRGRYSACHRLANSQAQFCKALELTRGNRTGGYVLADCLDWTAALYCA